jgi:hypothetical protein
LKRVAFFETDASITVGYEQQLQYVPSTSRAQSKHRSSIGSRPRGERGTKWSLSKPPAVGCTNCCDATQFCKWAGKRLCGKIDGGALDMAQVADVHADQWYNACSGGGKTTYAYGDTEDTSCYSSAPAGAQKQCERGFPGLYDMSDGAFEWTTAPVTVAPTAAAAVADSGVPAA